jgi:hypothetical protein
MLINTVQFQKGLSLPEFLEQYGTKEQCAMRSSACEDALAKWLDLS